MSQHTWIGGHAMVLARSRGRRRLSTLLSVGAVAGLVLLSAVVTAQPAAAATKAHGFQGGTGEGSGWLGNVLVPGGALAYCVDPAGNFPSGTTVDAGLVGAIPGTSAAANPGHNGTRTVTGIDIQKLNYAIATYGPAAVSDTLAAGLAAYVNSVTSSLHPGDGVSYYINIRVPVAKRAGVLAQYNTIKADVNAHYGWAIQTNSAHLSIAMDATPALTGVVHVSVTPATATGTLTLQGAVFTATGLTTSPATDGANLAIIATALTGQDLYSVNVSGKFSAPTYYSTNVREHTTSTPADSQRVITAGTKTSVGFTATAFVDDPLALQFEPVLTTKVTDSFVDPNTPIVDRLEASVSDDSPPWVQDVDGNFVPILASGYLYCGLARRPTPGEVADNTVKIFGPLLLTLNGPGSYSTSAGTSCPVDGYATWVWSISSAAQSGAALANLPTGYDWESEFGDATETSFVRADIVATSQVAADTIGLSQGTHDVVTIALESSDAVWPSDSDGNVVPISVNGTAYWVAGDEPPSQSQSAPLLAVPVGSSSIMATGTGDYATAEIVPTSHESGYLVWVWSIDPSAYARGFSEQFGEPTQIARVVAPSISSVADRVVALTDLASDDVTVTGPQMGAPAVLTWAAYRQTPGIPATCDLTNLVFSSDGAPLEISDPGSYAVPVPPQFQSLGTYLWVATLSARDGSVIAQGHCGDASESTVVVPFSLATSAVDVVLDGSVAIDTATIEGPVPSGATLDFAIYKQRGSVPRCDGTSLLWRSQPIALAGAGVIQSDPVRVGTGTYFWVATAYDRNGNVLQSGVCGDPAEVTTGFGTLAFTGYVFELEAPWITAAALVIAGLVFYLSARHSRVSRSRTQIRLWG
jgi:hypothetical protein